MLFSLFRSLLFLSVPFVTPIIFLSFFTLFTLLLLLQLQPLCSLSDTNDELKRFLFIMISLVLPTLSLLLPTLVKEETGVTDEEESLHPLSFLLQE